MQIYGDSVQTEYGRRKVKKMRVVTLYALDVQELDEIVDDFVIDRIIYNIIYQEARTGWKADIFYNEIEDLKI